MKLFVGNFPYETTEAELRALFEEVGPVVLVEVITDRATQRPKGFAFVTMAQAADGPRAIEQLRGRQVGRRQLTVDHARDKPRMRPSNGYDRRDGQGRRDDRDRGSRNREW